MGLLNWDKEKAFLEEVMMPDYLSVDPQGHKSTRESTIEFNRQEIAKIKSLDRYDIQIQGIKLHGNTRALVNGTYHVAYLISDADGKTHRVTWEGKSLDTWIKTPTGWKLQQNVDSLMRAQIDGRP